MNVDCNWIEDNLEALFCDRLTSEQHRLARAHMENCFQCREKIAALNEIDPLVRQVFQQDLLLARVPRPRRSRLLIGAFGAAAVAAALLLVVRMQPPVTTPPAAPPSIVASTPEQAPVPKIQGATNAPERAKPEPTPADSPAVTAPKPAAPSTEKAPEFLVSDLAGYSRTLNDYRGYVLIFGVWSAEQPQTVTNMERIYKAVGTHTNLRVLGVSERREAKPANATFPMAFNQGSTLIGAAPGQFFVVDGNGSVQFRGNLLAEPSSVMTSLRNALEPLGILIRGQW